MLLTICPERATALETILASSPPERCAGYGNLQSISLSDWELGLGSWTVGTHDVANPGTFDTPDWAVVGSLPDSQPGMAAFVADLVAGDCGFDDQTGALTLDSPPIVIPGGTEVPRISIAHWFEIESGWDGGNLKIKKGGGPFRLIPASAIEVGPYSGTLFPALDEFGGQYNTNPLADDQDAFTGTIDGKPTGSWIQSRINLLGIAAAGDTIQLRFDFGVDNCTVDAIEPPFPIGWYVDEVEFYSCEAELPPSNCGNGVIDGGEECDDGNNFIDDGCSNTCQIDSGWQCTAPTPPGTIADPSFEAGRPNPFWEEISNNGLGSPICDAATCGTGGGTGPADGTFWIWLGGVKEKLQEGSVSQSIVIPSTATELTFDLEVPVCDSALDYFEVLIDGSQVLLVDGSSPRCGIVGYATQSVDISAYADGFAHEFDFHSVTVSNNGGYSNFFIDVLAMPGSPSFCRREGTALTLMKEVINNDGGRAFASAWTLEAAGPTPFSGFGPTVFSGQGFAAGTYDLAESGGPAGYSASSWNCVGGHQVDGNTITLALDEAATCTITNDDIAPTLTVFKTVVNDGGGSITDPNAFGLKIDGLAVLHNAAYAVDVGDHTVSENSLPGYQSGTWGGDCNADGSITLVLDQDAICTITNNDIKPTLKVVKTIINDDLGTITDPNAFGLRVDGGLVMHNVPNAFAVGEHNVSEDGVAGYAAGAWGGDCSSNGTITLALAQDATCTLTNDDSDTTGLTLVKQVISNNGGTASASAWTLAAIGPTGFSGNGPSVSNGAGFLPGTYDLAESGGPAGYSASSWNCVGGHQVDGNTITLALDEAATCTITNDDIAPTLTVFKTVVNDGGGSITDPNAFGLKIDGLAVLHNAAYAVDVGDHTVSENSLPGYQSGTWGGDCNADGSITLVLDQDAICTITNNDIKPTLKVIKTIVNNNGGTITDPNAFGLKIDGLAVLNYANNVVAVGDHTVSENSLPGYQSGTWGGDCNADGTITLALGQNAICTITNDDIAPTLTVVKTIVNNNGGTITDPNSFGLKVDGRTVLHNATNNFNAGNHMLSEDGLPGYLPSTWGGDCNPDGTITLALDQDATCTLTNDDSDSTGLTLIKQVINNSGGTASASAWTLTATGPTGFSGSGPSVSNGAGFLPGTYDLTESGGLAGYFARPWDCIGGTQNDGDTITLALGASATCTIINDDLTPTLRLIKTIINDDGGTVTVPNSFNLRVNGFKVNHNAVNAFPAGSHLVSEDGRPGYQGGTWGGDCNPDGSITLALDQDAVCTITNNDISPTLTVLKFIVNDNGGTTTDPNAFGLKVNGGAVLHGATNNFMAGNHTLSESGLPGYIPSPWGGDCNPDGTITLALDQNATCTITNNDAAETSLTLVKQVINDNGGGAPGSAWTLTAAGPTPLSGSGPIVLSGPGFSPGTYVLSESNGPGGYIGSRWVCVGGSQLDGDWDTITLVSGQAATCSITNDDVAPTLTVFKTVINDSGGSVTDPNTFGLRVDGSVVTHNVATVVTAGGHTVSEDGLPGYQAGTWGGDCNSDGSIILALDQDATCSITNDDKAPTLTVVKTIINDNGGTVTDQNAFGLKVDGGVVPHNVANIVSVGNHTVSEVGLSGYAASTWGGDCNSDGTITLALGQNATCSITNNDIAPTITAFKTVINDSGGSVTDPNTFGLRVDGSVVTHNVATVVTAGGHTVSEDGLPGYQAGTWGGDCNSDGSIILALDQDATCSITNDDKAPTLTVVKTIINDNGGTVTDQNAFGLKVDGGAVLHNATNEFSAGSHTVSEAGLPGYQPSAWGGDCNADGTITLAPGDAATCTITNDDISPTLKVVKNITNNNGGTVTDQNAFGLKVDGQAVLHNASNEFDAGSHTVSEDGLPGYQAGTWGGDCNSDGTITLALDQDATCSITNDDKAPTLTVVKTIINDNGGTVTDQNAFGLKVDGGAVLHNASNPFDAGPHSVSETGLPGYVPGAWGGDCNADGTITLALDQDATCTVTNDDTDGTSLTLVKVVKNDNGGVAAGSAWTLSASGPTPFSGPGPSVSNDDNFSAGTYDLAETGSTGGYTASAWDCVGGTQNDGDTITLALDESAICTITNDDISPTLRVVKTIVNDNGGTVTNQNAFGLKVDGGAVLHNASNPFDAGPHTVSEAGLPGYAPGAWGGDCNADGTITLALDQDATCTITNDDIITEDLIFSDGFESN